MRKMSMRAMNHRCPKMMSIEFQGNAAKIVDSYGNHSEVQWNARRQIAYASGVYGCNGVVYRIPYVNSDYDYVVAATKDKSPVFSQVC